MVNVSTSRESNSERNETFQCLLEVGEIADNTPVALFRSVATVTIQDLNIINGMLVLVIFKKSLVGIISQHTCRHSSMLHYNKCCASSNFP